MNVLDRMIFDINRRNIIEKNRIYKAKSPPQFKETEFFKRMEQDNNRRVVTKEKLLQLSKQKEQEEFEKHLVKKKIPKTQKEATFSRLIADASSRQETFEMRKKIKELSDIEASKEISSIKLSKDQVSNLVERLQDFEKKKWEKINYIKRIQEQKEIDELMLMQSRINTKKESDPETFERLIKPKAPQPVMDSSDEKLFSLKDAIASGIRLMNAHKEVKQEPQAESPKLSAEQISELVTRLYTPSQTAQNTPRGQASNETHFRPHSINAKNQKMNKNLSLQDLKIEGKKDIENRSEIEGKKEEDSVDIKLFHRKPIALRLKEMQNDKTFRQLLPVESRRKSCQEFSQCERLEVDTNNTRSIPSAIDTYKILVGDIE
mmetsp:Transcript_9259/g.9251  ORF Transcript_9259/g.9251 Transcript_9259/m.9251 type:complete len:376 (+) Transcript_9259:236-1363(+)